MSNIGEHSHELSPSGYKWGLWTHAELKKFKYSLWEDIDTILCTLGTCYSAFLVEDWWEESKALHYAFRFCWINRFLGVCKRLPDIFEESLSSLLSLQSQDWSFLFLDRCSFPTVTNPFHGKIGSLKCPHRILREQARYLRGPRADHVFKTYSTFFEQLHLKNIMQCPDELLVLCAWIMWLQTHFTEWSRPPSVCWANVWRFDSKSFQKNIVFVLRSSVLFPHHAFFSSCKNKVVAAQNGKSVLCTFVANFHIFQTLFFQFLGQSCATSDKTSDTFR